MIRVFDTSITDEDRAAVEDVLRSGWIGPGEKVAEFERLLCEATGKKYAVCCNSGTTALMLALMANKVLPLPCAVRFPAYGMDAGARAARLIGIDVELYDLGQCPTNSGKVIVAVNQNGIPAKIEDDIEDACQSLGIPGAFRNGVISTLSFSPQKLVTTGQGGAVLTDMSLVESEVRNLVEPKRGGGNFRMSDVNAALGISQMKRLPQLIATRERIHQQYREQLESSQGTLECGWCVTYRTPHSQRLSAHLAERGIESLQPYKAVPGFPKAERLAKELLYLPSHLNLAPQDVNRVCDAILELER